MLRKSFEDFERKRGGWGSDIQEPTVGQSSLRLMSQQPCQVTFKISIWPVRKRILEGLKPGVQNVPSQKAEQPWTQVSQLILMFSPLHPRHFCSYTETWTCNEAQSPRHKERQKKKNRARKLSRGMLQHWSTKSSVLFPRIRQVLAQTRQALSSTQYMVYSRCILEGIYHGILCIKCIEQCNKLFLRQLLCDDFLPSF